MAASTSPTSPHLTSTTITRFYPNTRLAQYIDAFKRDPFTLVNKHLLRDHCEWAATNAGYVLAKKRLTSIDPLEPAEFRIIGEIESSSYGLYPCGKWNEFYGEDISKAKATGRLRSGRTPQVETLWSAFLDVISNLMLSRGLVPARVRNFSLLDDKELKIRHKIFHPTSIATHRLVQSKPHWNVPMPYRTGQVTEDHLEKAGTCKVHKKDRDAMATNSATKHVEDPDRELVNDRESSNTTGTFNSVALPRNIPTTSNDVSSSNHAGDDRKLDAADKPSNDGLSSMFDMTRWPCQSSQVQAALDALIASNLFVGHPLPVFDFQGRRIPPIDHERKLKGALVDVTVRITHVTYRQFSFFADITSIRILAPPGYAPEEPSNIQTKKKSKYSRSARLKEFAPTFGGDDDSD